MCMVVCFREHATVAILAANSKQYFWAAWTAVTKDCRSHFAWQCVYSWKRGRSVGLSGVLKASVLLPVHVVLVPPLLVPSSWPVVVVTNKLWTAAWSGRCFFSHFFVNTGGIHARTLTPTDTSQWSCSSKHNGYHVVYRSTISINARGATISFMFRHCKSSISLALVFTYADELVAQFNGCVSSTSPEPG